MSSPFTEEAVARGVSFLTPFTPPQNFPYGRGMAFADLDNDGDPDLVLTGAASGQIGVYQNNSGVFVNRSGTSSIPQMNDASAVVAFDYDGDGDLDLFITQWNAPHKLLRNNGNFIFGDVTTAVGIQHFGPASGPTIADYDGDGWLDIFVSYYGEPNRLFRNLNGVSFIDVTSATGIFGTFRSLQSSFFDMDGDGDKDIYISNDQRVPTNTTEYNRMYENVGGSFIEVSAQTGTDIRLLSMNVGLGDLDQNGFLDIYCTNGAIPQVGQLLPSFLLMNNGQGMFTQAQQQAGVESFRFGWGARFLDVDHNGFLDLYVCNQIGENRLYMNSGIWPLIDIAPELQVNLSGDSRCVAAADIDSDGDLDLAVQTYDEPFRLFINQSGPSGKYIRIRPIGQSPNRHSIGAVVRVRTESIWQMTELIAGDTYKTQSELVAHFGVAQRSIVDQIHIEWYDGATRDLHDLSSNSEYQILHPGLMGDADSDGDVDATDTAAFVAMLLGNATADLSRFDFSGDGIVNGDDIVGYIERMLTDY